jgi:hypothetical protein
MVYDDNLLFANAITYCEDKGLSMRRQDSLGHGSDGAVWKTSAPSAVKAIYKRNTFEIELECYRRLKAKGVRRISHF